MRRMFPIVGGGSFAADYLRNPVQRKEKSRSDQNQRSGIDFTNFEMFSIRDLMEFIRS